MYERSRQDEGGARSATTQRALTSRSGGDRGGGETVAFVWRAGLQPGATHRVFIRSLRPFRAFYGSIIDRFSPPRSRQRPVA
jgi:hypothetical protein